MRWLLGLALFLVGLWPNLGLASSIFIEPPPSTRYEGFVIVQMQEATVVEAACGPDAPYGCFGWLRNTAGSMPMVTCIIRIRIDLLKEMRDAAEVNLRARCSGWNPNGTVAGGL